MNGTSALVFAGIAPHPPIMVPEVGREAIAEVRESIDAMAELTSRVIASGAETIILISPHAPLESKAFVAYQGPHLYGDFANFRAPQVTVEAEVNQALLAAIATFASEQNHLIRLVDSEPLDHGIAVPLYFLQRNGWTGRVIALGYNFLPNEDHVQFGKSIRKAVDSVGSRVAFIASGDLSHRLKLGAPAGYNKNAHRFDEEVISALRSGTPERVIEIDQDLRRLAGECGYRSMLVAFGAADGLAPAPEVLSYEAPFGVGYVVAQLVSAISTLRVTENAAPKIDRSEPESSAVADLPALARLIVETWVRKNEVMDLREPSGDLAQLAACFVSIKTRDGELRGCIGTTEPTKDSLAEELIANAISAATRDPRFPPIEISELANLKYSVDVLSPPEAATISDLDPELYGVIVEDRDGAHRGLLLPNLRGVDTAEKQVRIAASKAGIPEGAELRLWRFLATRYYEQGY